MNNAAKSSYESEGFLAHNYLNRAKEQTDSWDFKAKSKLTSVLAEERSAWRTVRTITTVRTFRSSPEQLTFDFKTEINAETSEQPSALAHLEVAARQADESAFLKNLEDIKWQDRTADDFVHAIKLAFRAGAFAAACHIAAEGIKYQPDSPEVQRYARVLNPAPLTRTEAKAKANPQANRAWLKAHASEYRGQWLALRDGELLGAADALNTLVQEVGGKYGISFPSKDVMITMGY